MPKARRSEAEIAGLVAGYEHSGPTRRQYCERAGLALTTLDCYRQKRKKRKSPGLVAVRLTPGETGPAQGIALVLRNGRRIEINGEIVEAELAKLVRVAEQA